MTNKKLPSDTFCALPWLHLSSRPDGKMRTCCTSNASSVQDPDSSIKIGGGEVGIVKNDDGIPANFNHTSLKEAWNSSYMRNVRKMMLRGEKPASCLKCYKEEASGHLSKRNWETQYWGDRYDLEQLVAETNEDGSIPTKIRYIDLRMGSKCQLACVMCSPHDSSGWIKPWKEIYPQIQNEKLKQTSFWNKGHDVGASYNWHKNNPRFWKELMEQVPHMYQLYFAGGESLIIEEHYNLLEECIKQGYAKNIELRYNSNAVEWRSDLFDLWAEFKRVRFHYSIDAHGEHNDYIRYPSQWAHQEEVFWKLDNTAPQVEVTTATTILALNVAYIPEFVKWKVNQGFKKINKWPLGAGGINMHFAYWPPQLNVKVLPLDVKKEITEKYQNEFYPWIEDNWQNFTGVAEAGITKEQFLNADYGVKRFKGIINFMNSEDWSMRLPETVEYLKLVNKQRNWDNKFLDVFPIFKGIMNG
jgi:MoaA/NifB/PqqE/SkfB family radical SAM enzyme